MRPYTSAADEKYRSKVRTWAEHHLAKLDDDSASDADVVELVRAMGRAKLLDRVVPREGEDASELRSSALCVAREELARVSPLVDTMYAMQGLGSYPIALAGDSRQKRAYLPDVAAGRKVAAFALTEQGAGSDVAAMTTTAVLSGAHYRIAGEKKFISNAGVADFYIVFAKTDPSAGGRGISAFIVDARHPGVSVSERTKLNAAHPIGRLRFDGCLLTEADRLGAEGDGLKIALGTLDTFRATVGAAACGIAQRALEETIARVRTRQQFGKPLAEFQATRFRLADMAMRLEAARGLVYRAAWTRDSGERPTRIASMAKLAATEWAFRIVDDAVQLHGGDGLVRGNVVERLAREVRALRIYEGTSEIQHLVIAREMLDRN